MSEISTPLSEPGLWHFTAPGLSMGPQVRAVSFFEARAVARVLCSAQLIQTGDDVRLVYGPFHVANARSRQAEARKARP